MADYLDSFEKTNGRSEIPEYYSKTQGRKIIDNDSSLGTLIKNPNKIAVVIIFIAAGIVLFLAAMIVVTVKLVRHRGRKQ